jgi:uncharacterized protein with HEPN domain
MRGNVDRQCLEKMLSYCDRAIALLEICEYNYERFKSDQFFLSISMIEMQMGEITTHLTEEFKKDTKNQVPWQMMKDMRNMFAHAYDGMDRKIIWDTAIESIPELKKFCENYLNENEA